MVIYNITGIPKDLWAQIESAPLNEQQRNVLNNVKDGGNSEMIEQSTMVLRNYIRKGSAMLLNSADTFKNNLLQLLFLLVAEVYKKGPGKFTGEIEMTCCSALLINFVENSLSISEPILLHIWQLAKFNIHKLSSRNLKGLNCQLLAMLIYSGGSQFLSIVNNDNMLDKLLKEITDHENKLE